MLIPVYRLFQNNLESSKFSEKSAVRLNQILRFALGLKDPEVVASGQYRLSNNYENKNSTKKELKRGRK